MADGRIELGKARILVSNDDGIGSPGIKLLQEIARDLSAGCLGRRARAGAERRQSLA